MLHCLSLLARRGARGARERRGRWLRPQNVGKCDKDTPVLCAEHFHPVSNVLGARFATLARACACPTSPMHTVHSEQLHQGNPPQYIYTCKTGEKLLVLLIGFINLQPEQT